MLIAIDPGVHACGVAMFSTYGDLRLAALVRAAPQGSWAMAAQAVCELVRVSRDSESGCVAVIERPRIYPGRRREDPNDLLSLAGVVGAITMALHIYGARVDHVFPADWKGQVPKRQMGERILARLSAGELARVEDAGSKTHNIVDAIGIGLFANKRMKRGGGAA